jgi:hypothetical protein
LMSAPAPGRQKQTDCLCEAETPHASRLRTGKTISHGPPHPGHPESASFACGYGIDLSQITHSTGILAKHAVRLRILPQAALELNTVQAANAVQGTKLERTCESHGPPLLTTAGQMGRAPGKNPLTRYIRVIVTS